MLVEIMLHLAVISCLPRSCSLEQKGTPAFPLPPLKAQVISSPFCGGNRQEDLLWTNWSDLCLQFNVKKSTEPVQPRALLKFPDIYGPRPAVTAPEVINYADYTLKTTAEPAAPASPQAPNDSRLKRQVTEELFVLPQNGRALLLLTLVWTIPSRVGKHL